MPANTPTPTPPRPKERELAQWDERFDRADYWFGTEPTPFLAEQAHRLKPGMNALAIADGEGRNGVWLARQGLKVTTVDLSPKGIAKAQLLAKRFGVTIETICADLESWDWGAPRFDLVVGILFQFAGPAWRSARRKIVTAFFPPAPSCATSAARLSPSSVAQSPPP